MFTWLAVNRNAGAIQWNKVYLQVLLTHTLSLFLSLSLSHARTNTHTTRTALTRMGWGQAGGMVSLLVLMLGVPQGLVVYFGHICQRTHQNDFCRKYHDTMSTLAVMQALCGCFFAVIFASTLWRYADDSRSPPSPLRPPPNYSSSQFTVSRYFLLSMLM